MEERDTFRQQKNGEKRKYACETHHGQSNIDTKLWFRSLNTAARKNVDNCPFFVSLHFETFCCLAYSF